VPWSAKQLPWSLSEILFQVPATSGVYAIWRHEVPVYIGESDDLLRRLLEHFKGSNECISREHPTSFSFELLSGASRVTRREALTREMLPICNSPS
jgi:predicted GIY-YIG superfamily endonuclease